MKVYVEIGAWVDVEEGGEVLETLKKIHESDADAVGTSAQYEEEMAQNTKVCALLESPMKKWRLRFLNRKNKREGNRPLFFH